MAISLANAQAAIRILRASTGTEMFQAMTQSQGYLFSKHQNKAKALQAAIEDNQAKGYFKKIVTIQVGSLADYRELTDHQKGRIQGLGTNTKITAKSFGKTRGGEQKDIKTTQKEALSGNDFATLLYQIINGATLVGYYEANAEVNQRFIYMTMIPLGYVGRSIDPAGTKTKDLPYAVVIIVAKPGEAPFILNMFPADNEYHRRQVALV